MKQFQYTLNNPYRGLSSDLENYVCNSKGWFKNSSNTAHIHPFFRKETFSDVDFFDNATPTFKDKSFTEDNYQSFKPALRLATAMLENTKEFWIKVLHAPIYGASDRQLFEPNFQPQDLHTSWLDVERHLSLMTRYTRICWFRDSRNDNSQYSGISGDTYLSRQQGNEPKLRLRMALHRDMYDALFDPYFHHKSTSEQCIVYINFAITLIHELAHTVYSHRRIDVLTSLGAKSQGHLASPEPYICFSQPRELGEVFEISHLGGILATGGAMERNKWGKVVYRARYDGSRGLGMKMQNPANPGEYRQCAVPDETILMLLHETTWAPNSQTRLYLVPMDRNC